MSDDAARRLHDAENADFSAYLHTLDEADWDRPSLCDGWRVSGTAEALLMTMLGRAQPLDELGGAGLATFAGRVRS